MEKNKQLCRSFSTKLMTFSFCFLKKKKKQTDRQTEVDCSNVNNLNVQENETDLQILMTRTNLQKRCHVIHLRSSNSNRNNCRLFQFKYDSILHRHTKYKSVWNGKELHTKSYRFHWILVKKWVDRAGVPFYTIK